MNLFDSEHAISICTGRPVQCTNEEQGGAGWSRVEQGGAGCGADM